jgi:hypothetical protein
LTDSISDFFTPLPPVVVGLRRAILLWRIAPPQAIAVDEDYSAQHPPVIVARLAMALGEEGLEPSHLRVGQPEKIAHRLVSLRSLNHAERARSMGPDPRTKPEILIAYEDFKLGSLLCSSVNGRKATLSTLVGKFESGDPPIESKLMPPANAA